MASSFKIEEVHCQNVIGEILTKFNQKTNGEIKVKGVHKGKTSFDIHIQNLQEKNESALLTELKIFDTSVTIKNSENYPSSQKYHVISIPESAVINHWMETDGKKWIKNALKTRECGQILFFMVVLFFLLAYLISGAL